MIDFRDASRRNDHEPAGSVQRWSHRDYCDDHGAGTAITVATDLASTAENSTDFSKLRAEFSGGRDHVGEPSSFDPCGAEGYGGLAVVKLKFAFLDVVGSVCDRVPWEELPTADGGGFVWAEFIAVCSGVLCVT